MRVPVRALFIAFAISVFSFSFSQISRAADSFAGVFENDRLRAELAPSAGGFSGTLALGGSQFTLTARQVGDHLEGSFVSGGKSFDFSATLDNHGMILKSGATAYALTRKAGAATGQPRYIKFARVGVPDPMSGCDSGTVLLPVGWKLEGGVIWRWNAYFPTTTSARVFDPNSPDEVRYYPSMIFEDGVRESAYQSAIIAGREVALAAAARFPEGFVSGGFEVRRRVPDMVTAVKEFFIPRLRPDLRGAKIVEAVDLPQVVRAKLAAAGNAPGAAIMAARVRFAYELNGVPIEEDIYCTFGGAPVVAPIFSWGLEFQSFRAPKGTLDEKMKLFQTINNSLVINIKWYAGMLSVQQAMIQGARQAQDDQARLQQYLHNRSDEVSKAITDSYWKQQKTYDQINDARSQANRGVQRFADPITERPIDLPNYYERAFTNNRGEIIMSNDASFDPGVQFHEDWKEMKAVKPGT